MTKASKVLYRDYVAAQDDNEPVDRDGTLFTHTASETVTWVVNGHERITMSWPELEAFIEAAGAEFRK